MNYLLDTNVISELYKPRGSEKVNTMIAGIPLENLYLSVITLGEMSYGIERLPANIKKHELSIFLYSTLPEWFKNRILPLDNELAIGWGRMRARVERTLPSLDSLIAATALMNNMTLITGNTKDFEDIPGLALLNPWD